MTSSHFLSFVTCLGSNLGPRHSLKWHLIATSWHFMTAHTAYYLPQIQSEVKVKIHMTHESWQMDFRWLVTLVHLPCHSRSHDPFERLLWRVSVEVELTVDAMLDLCCRCCKGLARHPEFLAKGVWEAGLRPPKDFHVQFVVWSRDLVYIWHMFLHLVSDWREYKWLHLAERRPWFRRRGTWMITYVGQDGTCCEGRGGLWLQLPLLLRNKWYPVRQFGGMLLALDMTHAKMPFVK